jgi:hypothetical protein
MESVMNEFQQVYPNAFAPQQLVPQGIFGSLGGGALGGLIGRGIGSIFHNSGLGGQIGQTIGGIGGAILPFNVDPVTAAYAQQIQQHQLQQQLQQGQLAPQGWIGNLIGQVGQPLGGAIGGIFGQSGLGSTIGGAAAQLGRLLPFGADPISAAYAQQQQQQVQLQQLQQLQELQQQQQLQQLAQQGQLAPQGFFGNLLGHVARPVGGAIGGIFGQSGVGNTVGGIVGGLGRMLPFGADPVAQAYAQQAQQQQLAQLQQQAQLQQLAQQGQLAPQGWFGNVLSQVGQPLGGAIGGIFGQSGIGNAIGGAAAQLGRMLPFGVDPVTAQAYAQQAQLQQQLMQQQIAQQQQAQLGQQANGYFGGFQGNPGVGQQANLYGGQQTVH